MAKLTRRGFFKQSSIGAAAFSLLAMMPFSAPLAADSAEVDTSELSTGAFTDSIVAHVRDVSTGEITLMSGVKEVVVRDPQLVARLLKAAG